MAQEVGAGLWHMWHFHGSYGFRHPDPQFPFGIRLKRLPDWVPGRGLREDVVMSWILDEYSKSPGHSLASITGKPLELGGSRGHEAATGRGVALMVREAARHMGLDFKRLRVAVQGFGKVGSNAAQFVAALGCKIVAVSDAHGGIQKAAGINIEELKAHVKASGSVAGFAGARKISNDELLETDCDLLVPAALECALHAGNAARVRAKLIVEGASLPTTPAADAVFERKGTVVLPDILANAGGVICSYFEWAQNLEQASWDEERVSRDLEQSMVKAYQEVAARAKEQKLTLRTAAYCTAVERVARACPLSLAPAVSKAQQTAKQKA